MTSPECHVYLDHAATTPVRDEVREAMAPYLADVFGNPSSQHRWGREASSALENARAEAAEALGAKASEICFVRGGTEGDNLAVVGGCRALAASGEQPTLIVTAIEHHAVLDVAQAIAEQGLARLVTLEVAADGSIDLDAVREAMVEGPTLLSCMWVNNETGMLLPIEELAALASAGGATLHTDAVQAIGKVRVDLGATPVHLLTISGHKIYGPKGTGMLYVRRGTTVAPMLRGGGQERALRPGTEDVAGAVGISTALRLVTAEREAETARLCRLRDRLEARVTGELEGARVNAGTAARAPHVSNMGFEGVDGSLLLISLDLEGVAASGASACTAGSGRGSHVIAALYGSEDSLSNVRFSVGRATTTEDIERAASVTVDVVRRLREAK